MKPFVQKDHSGTFPNPLGLECKNREGMAHRAERGAGQGDTGVFSATSPDSLLREIVVSVEA